VQRLTIQLFYDCHCSGAVSCRPVGIPEPASNVRRVLGRGRRGTGVGGDDQHAENNASDKVGYPSQLSQATSTLYTTLEPCTKPVRTKELECCTEMILQHGIKRVVIGILDPNQEWPERAY
jgi:diaminohydroxyphosphoribosylaminopyrimidine deaminase / 5-amino-6-(5-phosphoribosylamino)uracil reductase